MLGLQGGLQGWEKVEKAQGTSPGKAIGAEKGWRSCQVSPGSEAACQGKQRERASVPSQSPSSLVTPAPARRWVHPHCPSAGGHGYAALFGSGAVLLSVSVSRQRIPEHLWVVKQCSGSRRLLRSLQQTHNARCCNGWAVLKASACPCWSGAGRFPRAGLMQRQLQSAAVSGVNTLALPQLPMLPGRLNSCLGLAEARLQPKARATCFPLSG